ncbi:MAG: hypothetical protein KA275_02800 [Chitinophagaceae bacterium]|nr:hypothetical protein [Bacteroidota bacterium]MBL0078909.1 hypothetical protein [Bacteroidota bacterium]MBP6455636.1 hypothetical protein [Chitinophagaceae bacterium]
MLINISNHSYALWKPKQLITALEKFDKVEDFFMPEVNPAFTADQVREMASKIIADIFIQYQHTDETINLLIAGEQSLVFYLISFGLQNQIPCFVATSKRNTVLNSDGTKTIQFEFEQFRQIIK